MKLKLKVLLVACTLIVSLMTGCIKSSDTVENDQGKTQEQVKTASYAKTGELPITYKPITLTMLIGVDNPLPKESFVFDRIEELTGIKIIPQHVNQYDLDQRFDLLLAAKNLPDICPVGVERAEQYGTLGAFVPINKFFDILPAYKEIYDKEGYIRKNQLSSDGNLYFFATYQSSREVNHGMLYRKDIFDKHGIQSPPDGPDEWFDALKALKEIYPNSTPFVCKTGDVFFRDMYTSWGNSMIDHNNYFGYDHDDDMFKFAPVTEEWKQMLEYLNKLMVNGILDPEFLTSSLDDWSAKMTKETQSFATYDWVDRMILFHDAVKDRIPDYNLRYGYPMGPTGKHYSLSQVQDGGLGVPSESKHIEPALQLIDWLYTDDGCREVTIGQEGVTFIRDENGNIRYHELEKVGIEPVMNSLRDEYGLMQIYTRMHPECVYFNLHDGLKEGIKMLKDDNRILPYFPRTIFTNEEEEEKLEFYASLKKAAVEYSANVIYGTKNTEEDWDKWLRNAEQLGYKRGEEIENNAYARYKK